MSGIPAQNPLSSECEYSYCTWGSLGMPKREHDTWCFCSWVQGVGLLQCLLQAHYKCPELVRMHQARLSSKFANVKSGTWMQMPPTGQYFCSGLSGTNPRISPRADECECFRAPSSTSHESSTKSYQGPISISQHKR